MLRSGTDGSDGSGGASKANGAHGADAAAMPEAVANGRPDAAAEPGMLGLRCLDRGELAVLCRNELVDVLADIERLANRLTGYRVEVLGALDELSRSGAAPDATPHLTLRDATGVSEREARRLRRVASKARENTTVLDALSQGDINATQAEALCDARVPEAVRAGLIADAGAQGTDTTRRRIREAETLHCAESPTERFMRQRAARGAGWERDPDGMFKLWARLDPESGAQVQAALEPLQRAMWQHDKQQRTGRRTPAQRDADILAYALAGVTMTNADAEVVAKLVGGAQPDGGHEPGGSPGRDVKHEPGGPMRRLAPAQINVVIGLEALRGETDETGITDAGTELAPETVRRLACDNEIIPIILGGPGGPADIGRARRTVPIRLRRLLIARDKHCRWPGCHAPPSRCDAHHVIHWARGGPTNLDNLLLLCHTHHQHLHEHGYELIPGPHGWTPTQQTANRRTANPRTANPRTAATRQPRAP